MLDWIRTAFKESHDDETRYHREVVDKLQKECKQLEAMSGDKLDGKVGERFYEQKSAAWRGKQKDLLRRLEEHQDASQSYMGEGIALMELAQRAADLSITWEKQPRWFRWGEKLVFRHTGLVYSNRMSP